MGKNGEHISLISAGNQFKSSGSQDRECTEKQSRIQSRSRDELCLYFVPSGKSSGFLPNILIYKSYSNPCHYTECLANTA